MGLGVAAIALSILCLIAAVAFGAPVFVNILGVIFGVVGMVLLGRARKSGGS